MPSIIFEEFVKALCENVNLDTLWKQWNVRLKMDVIEIGL